jgi:uncharacterized protein YceH (UPF0502 family)
MDVVLHPVEARVLAALVEKEITTPEYYPLSLNALVNACNQKSNRNPVVAYDEDTIERALESLREKGLLLIVSGAGSRVKKYGHRLSEKLNLGRRELAILCELMLRGPQTLGELKNRADRMHHFDDLAEVESVIDRNGGLMIKLERRPGEKEPRFAHLLCGIPEVEPVSEEHRTAPESTRADRVDALAEEVERLRAELEDLKQQVAAFRRQFE